MKQPQHEREADNIGEASFDLLNYLGLPVTASAIRQVEALKKDQEWQSDHNNEISKRIDYLISDIESTGQPEHTQSEGK